MADKKISALTSATAPLAGTEVLPIVQSSTTVKVAVSDLTAGRAVSATQYTSTIATGTAPLVIASTTNVANLNASSLNGATFAAPGTIGGTTPAAVTSTSFTSTSGNTTALSTTTTGTGVMTMGPATPSADGVGSIIMRNTNTYRNWRFGHNLTVPGAFEIIPSTANGGITFSTNVFYIVGSTGNVYVTSGNLLINGVGKGVTVTSPDGLTTKTITINNAGAITLI